MKTPKELMEAARPSWHEYFLEDGKLHVDSYGDDLYEAYLAGFAAGQRSVSSQTSNEHSTKE